jgi:predicted thioesterase
MNSQIVMEAGLEGSAEIVVGEAQLASAIGSGGVRVFSTPSMIALMESAAVNAVARALMDGQTTVGTLVNVQHMAATPPGMRVRAYARLLKVHGRLLEFEIWAEDDGERIGEGTHQRAVVDLARFEQKVAAKRT